MNETLNTIAHTLTAIVIAIVGWFVNRQVSLKDKFEADVAKKFREIESDVGAKFLGLASDVGKQFHEIEVANKDLDLRAQLAEVRMTRADTTAEAQADSLKKFHEDLSDIRENMVRRADLDALVGQITSAQRRPRRQ